MKKSKSLSQVQFLRAIAVILVVGFHAGQPFFAHGYLGVDIFFVISGFLMGYLYPNLGSRKGIFDFWSKRVVRLFPALIFVNLIFFLPLFMQFLPSERVALLNQYFSSALFISNFHFWSQEQYFATESLRPLLHTWSLGVEAQFYLIFPVLIALILKRRNLSLIIFSLSAVGFTFFMRFSTNSAFFLLPFRLWEFLVGTFIALHYAAIKDNWNKYKPFFPVALGICLIGYWQLRGASTSNFVLNFVAVLFAAMFIIFVDETPTKHSYLFRLLNFIGNRSYVIYLIHFPLLISFSYRPFEGNILHIDSFSQGLVYIVLLLALTEFVHRYVEFIRIPFFKCKSFVYISSSLILALLSILLSKSSISEIGSSDKVLAISNSQIDRSQFRCGTLARIQLPSNLGFSKKYCLISKKSQGFVALLIGNSHADAIKNSVGDAVGSLGGSLYLAQENMNLNAGNRKGLQEIVENLKADLVIFHSRSGTYDWESLSDFRDSLDNGRRRFLVLGPIPEFDFSVPKRLLDLQTSNLSDLTLADFERKYQDEIQMFKKYEIDGKLHYLSALEAFCDPYCRIANDKWQPFYFDSNHLTLTGAQQLVSILRMEITRLNISRS